MQALMSYLRKEEWSPYVAGGLLGLVGVACAVAQGVAHLLGAMAYDEHRLGDAERLEGVEHVGHHRLANERVKHLGNLGSHARALARGQHHGAEVGTRGIRGFAHTFQRLRGHPTRPPEPRSRGRAHPSPGQILARPGVALQRRVRERLNTARNRGGGG